MGWWLARGLAPANLEFRVPETRVYERNPCFPWFLSWDPHERNQGKQAHPVLKYRVPHGSHHNSPLAKCGCKKHALDMYGDNKKGVQLDWMVPYWGRCSARPDTLCARNME
jgi:hypothetical protein